MLKLVISSSFFQQSCISRGAAVLAAALLFSGAAHGSEEEGERWSTLSAHGEATESPSTLWSTDEEAASSGPYGLAAQAGLVLLLAEDSRLEALDEAGNLMWQADLDRARSDPTIAGDAIYLSDDDVLRSWNLDGTERWAVTDFDIYNRAAPVVGGNVYASGHRQCCERDVHAFDPVDGAFLWKARLSESSIAFMAADEGAVYGGDGRDTSDYGPLYAYNGADGELLWERDLGGSLVANPTIDGDTLYVSVAGPSPAIFALNAVNGAVRWSVPMNAVAPYLRSDADIASVVYGEWLFAVSGNTVFALDTATGAEMARFQAGASVAAMDVGERLYVGTSDDEGALYALDLGDLSVVWRHRLESRLTSNGEYLEDVIRLAASGDAVYATIQGDSSGFPTRVEAVGHSQVDVDNVALSSSASTVGEVVTATARVSNPGEGPVDYTVVFEIDGPLTPVDPDTHEVTGSLAAGAEEGVTVEFEIRHAGVYSVTAYEAGSGRFEPDPRAAPALVQATRAGVDDPSWGQSGYDGSKSGYNPNTSGPAGPMQQRWRLGDIGLRSSSEAVMGADRVFVRTADFSAEEAGVTAIGLESGQVDWSLIHGSSDGTSNGVLPQHAYSDGVVYYARSYDDVEENPDDPDNPKIVKVVHVYAVAAATGARLWDSRFENRSQPTPLTVDEDSLYFIARDREGFNPDSEFAPVDHRVYRIDKETGSVNYALRLDTSHFNTSAVSSSNGSLYFTAEVDDQPRLYKVERDTPASSYVAFDRPFRSLAAPPVRNGVVYVGTRFDDSEATVEARVGRIYAVDANDLSTNWVSAPTHLTLLAERLGGRDQARALAVNDTHVFVASGQPGSGHRQAVYGLAAETGEVDWWFSFSPTGTVSPWLAVADGVLYTSTTHIVARDPRTGQNIGWAPYHELKFDSLAVADESVVAIRSSEVVAWGVGATPEVSEVSLSSQEVAPGETAQVSAEVTNPGIYPTEIRVELLRSGFGSDEEDIVFEPGETKLVSFDYDAPLGDTSLGFRVTNRDLRGFERPFATVETDRVTLSGRTLPVEPTGVFVSAAELMVDQVMYRRGEGESLVVEATVRNIGSSTDSKRLELTVDSRVIASQEVNLGPGEIRNVTLSGSEVKIGSYSEFALAKVNGVSAGSFLAIQLSVDSLPESEISAGQSIELEVDVRQVEGLAVDDVLKLEANGEVIAEKPITIPAGEGRFDRSSYILTATFAQPGSFEISVNGVEASGSPLTVTAADPIENFLEWLSQYFDEEDLTDPNRVDPYGDPGEFGIPNVLRYAFNLDPRDPAAAALPKVSFVTVDAEGKTFLEIAYTARIGATDLSYEAQWSDDLKVWETTGDEFVVETVPQEGGLTERVRMRDRIAADQETPPRFLRVMVVLGDE